MLHTKEYSIISKPKSNLHPNLFQDGFFHKLLRKKILKQIRNIKDEFGLKIRYVWAIGSAVSYQYDKDSDIDINIAVKDMNEKDARDINRTIDHKYNNKIIFHGMPVNFHVQAKRYNYNFSDGIYDVFNNHWIKKPPVVAEQDIISLINNCKNEDILKNIIQKYISIQSSYYKMIDNPSVDNKKHFFESLVEFKKIYVMLSQKRRELYINGTKERISLNCISVVYKIVKNMGFDKLFKLLQ